MIKSSEELAKQRSPILFHQQELKHQAGGRREKEQLERSLRERVKELNCLYGVAELIERYPDSLAKTLQGIVELLPISWQYPDVTCARIQFKGRTYQTANFKTTRWKQETGISVAGQAVGAIEVCYLKKKPNLDEGPFLKEERLLLDAVSERIARTAEKNDIEQQLQLERQSLQDANVALHGVLSRIQQEKKMIGVSIQANIDKIISPILYALKPELDAKQLKYVTLLQKNLDNIVGPFVERNLDSLSRLSPVELSICNMIKHGLSSKEIAEMRGISPDTVNRHREHIRRKLGLTNRKLNLVSYLNSVPVA